MQGREATLLFRFLRLNPDRIYQLASLTDICCPICSLSLSLCWLNWFFAVLKGVWLESRVRTALGRRLANCECRAGVVRGCHRTAVYWPRCRPCRCRAERCCRPAEVTGARAPPSHRCLSPPHSRTLACQHSGPLAKSLPMVWRRKKAYKLLVSAVAKNSLPWQFKSLVEQAPSGRLPHGAQL